MACHLNPVEENLIRQCSPEQMTFQSSETCNADRINAGLPFELLKAKNIVQIMKVIPLERNRIDTI